MLTGKLVVDTTKKYKVQETADVLGISRSTLEKLTKAGEIHTVIHRPTKTIFYEGAEIERFYNCFL